MGELSMESYGQPPKNQMRLIASEIALIAGQVPRSTETEHSTNAAPEGGGGMMNTFDPEQQAQMWQTWISNRDAFWDNRFNKRNPRAPDFVHKETRFALWLQSAPEDVRVSLDNEATRQHG
eukprot:TRINITY_DN4326_c0_g1_i4.p1 TRINITY_DN4326_c0_g1~~TRINITY_DN4326_c0_g1_i4.p1  ORF type:complete len:121 (+),score=17.49 TRINITY_DN4326_c0_g1_i4:179-541(+)